MIDNATLKVLHQQVSDLLLNFQLADGLEGIALVTRECSDQQLTRSLESLSLSYNKMLDFLEQNGKDENRSQIQDELQKEAFRILNSAVRQVRIERAEDIYGKSYKRLILTYGESVCQILQEEWNRQQGMTERYETQDLIFDLLWTMPLWDSKDTAEWYEFISRQDTLVQQHFTGSVFLSCWEYFDTEKITFLRLMADAENSEVHSLCTTLLALILIRYERMLSIHPSLPLNLRSKRLSETFYQVQRELILMKESPKVNEEINKAITSINPSQPNFDQELKRSMRKMGEYAVMGFDMDLSKVPLLHSSRFLRVISHWWAPFDESRPMIQEFFTRRDGNLAQGMRNLFGRSTECSLNRYALCEVMSERIDLNAMENRLSGIFESMDEVSEIGPQPEFVIRNNVQNLFRFFYHSPLAKEVENPFEGDLLMPDNKYLRHCFGKQRMTDLCELLTKVHNTVPALRYLQELIAQDGASAKFLRMMGFCYKLQNKPRQAAQILSQADMLEENDLWTLTQLAECYAQSGQTSNLVDVLHQMEYLSPDDISIPLQIADCLNKINQHEDAMNYLYKVELAQPDNTDIMIRIMVCSALLGKFDIAEKYMNRRIESESEWKVADYLAIGDVFLMEGKWKEAIEQYQKAGNENFKRHTSEILSLGITDKDLSLIKDLVERQSN